MSKIALNEQQIIELTYMLEHCLLKIRVLAQVGDTRNIYEMTDFINKLPRSIVSKEIDRADYQMMVAELTRLGVTIQHSLKDLI